MCKGTQFQIVTQTFNLSLITGISIKMFHPGITYFILKLTSACFLTEVLNRQLDRCDIIEQRVRFSHIIVFWDSNSILSDTVHTNH